jgi:hypothetical protein
MMTNLLNLIRVEGGDCALIKNAIFAIATSSKKLTVDGENPST